VFEYARQDLVVRLVVERDVMDVVKQAREVVLDRVRVTRLSEDLKQHRVGHKEETREHESLLFEIPASQTD
jgi:hypothetical protein